MLKAIENGIFSDTTKARLDELEAQKKALTEKLLTEKSKERSIPTAVEIKKYLKYAVQKTPRNLVELLVDKIIVYKDKIEIFLKYPGQPPTTPPHNDNNPDGTFLYSIFYKKISCINIYCNILDVMKSTPHAIKLFALSALSQVQQLITMPLSCRTFTRSAVSER